MDLRSRNIPQRSETMQGGGKALPDNNLPADCNANMVEEAGKVTGWVSNLHSWDPEQKGCHVTRPFLKQGSCFVSSISQLSSIFAWHWRFEGKNTRWGLVTPKKQILRSVLTHFHSMLQKFYNCWFWMLKRTVKSHVHSMPCASGLAHRYATFLCSWDVEI